MKGARRPPGAASSGSLHHFQGAGAVRQAAQETAFLQRGDQPVDARLGRQSPGASFISSKEGETPVSLIRSWMNMSSSCCLRVNTVFSPERLPDFGTNPETRHMF